MRSGFDAAYERVQELAKGKRRAKAATEPILGAAPPPPHAPKHIHEAWRDLSDAHAKSLRAMERKMAHPVGARRGKRGGRSTTLNAEWSRAAEERDRVKDRYDQHVADWHAQGAPAEIRVRATKRRTKGGETVDVKAHTRHLTLHEALDMPGRDVHQRSLLGDPVARWALENRNPASTARLPADLHHDGPHGMPTRGLLRLHGLGVQVASHAADLQPGDVLSWNESPQAYEVAAVRMTTPAMMEVTERNRATGRESRRRMRRDKLVVARRG